MNERLEKAQKEWAGALSTDNEEIIVRAEAELDAALEEVSTDQTAPF